MILCERMNSMKKRYLLIVCAIALSIIMLMSCTAQAGSGLTEKATTADSGSSDTLPKDESYSASIIGFSDSISSSGLSIEYDLKDHETYKDHKIEDITTVTINGRKIKGHFTQTFYLGDNYFPVYEYVQGGESFMIDPDGKLVFYSGDRSESTSDVICTEAECIQIAKDFLATIVDADPYRPEATLYEGKYYIEFVKYIGEMKTTEWVKFTVTQSGEVVSYTAFMLDTIPANAQYSFDMDKAEAVVQERLDGIIAGYNRPYDRIEYNDESWALMRLKDGDYGLCYSVEMNFIRIQGPYEEHSGQLIRFVVTK